MNSVIYYAEIWIKRRTSSATSEPKIGAVLGGELHRYPDALADARRAHEMNPNNTFILRILGDLEAGAGQPERAIEHLHQVMRLSPRDPQCYVIYSALAFAFFAARRYRGGVSLGIPRYQGQAQYGGGLTRTLSSALSEQGILTGRKLHSRPHKLCRQSLSNRGWRAVGNMLGTKTGFGPPHFCELPLALKISAVPNRYGERCCEFEFFAYCVINKLLVWLDCSLPPLFVR
jgi:tetratricopeptide (TPR) repeat protein